MSENLPHRTALVPAFLLGLAAGSRSQLPLAVLATAAGRRPRAFPDGGIWGVLRSPRVRAGLTLSALGELVGDKLPIVPSRLDPGPLGGRIAFGGAAGYAVASANRGQAVLSVAAGMAGAVVGAHAGAAFRRTLSARTAVPDLAAALAEDAAALAVGSAAVRALERSATVPLGEQSG